MTENRRNPKILPWLARKAGISEHRAAACWRAACREASRRLGSEPTPEFWKLAMDELVARVAAEALAADSASFGFRRLARQQARYWTVPLVAFEVGAQTASRFWQAFNRPLAPH
ncbi:MAG: hypothetical protein JNM82_05650 [Rhodocyclaceae bacterium]|nr:hypothetical protein [Rhodocyclaceae bacterium]